MHTSYICIINEHVLRNKRCLILPHFKCEQNLWSKLWLVELNVSIKWTIVKKNGLLTFFQIFYFIFSRTNKYIQFCNYLRMSKWWQKFHFWVNYPFKNTHTVVPVLTIEGALWNTVYTHKHFLSAKPTPWGLGAFLGLYCQTC